mgnify:CR=1 FL=1
MAAGMLATPALDQDGYFLVDASLNWTSGDGRYRVDGMVFHMPGRWELAIDAAGVGSLDQQRHLFHFGNC